MLERDAYRFQGDSRKQQCRADRGQRRERRLRREPHQKAARDDEHCAYDASPFHFSGHEFAFALKP